jgi:hypothetical protein
VEFDLDTPSFEAVREALIQNRIRL